MPVPRAAYWLLPTALLLVGWAAPATACGQGQPRPSLKATRLLPDPWSDLDRPGPLQPELLVGRDTILHALDLEAQGRLEAALHCWLELEQRLTDLLRVRTPDRSLLTALSLCRDRLPLLQELQSDDSPDGRQLLVAFGELGVGAPELALRRLEQVRRLEALPECLGDDLAWGLARAAWLANLPGQARRELEGLLQEHRQSPRRPAARLLLGRVLLQLARRLSLPELEEEAEGHWRALVREHPGSPLVDDALGLLAGRAYQAGRLDVAMEGYLRILREHPDGDQVESARISLTDYVFPRMHAAGGSSGLIRAAVLYRQQLARMRSWRSYEADIFNEVQEALAEHFKNRPARLAPLDEEARYLLALSCYREGNLHRAITLLEDQLRLLPRGYRSLDAHMVLVDAHLRLARVFVNGFGIAWHSQHYEVDPEVELHLRQALRHGERYLDRAPGGRLADDILARLLCVWELLGLNERAVPRLEATLRACPRHDLTPWWMPQVAGFLERNRLRLNVSSPLRPHILFVRGELLSLLRTYPDHRWALPAALRVVDGLAAHPHPEEAARVLDRFVADALRRGAAWHPGGLRLRGEGCWSRHQGQLLAVGAMAAFELGRYEAALARTEACLAAGGSEWGPELRYVQALSAHRLGHQRVAIEAAGRFLALTPRHRLRRPVRETLLLALEAADRPEEALALAAEWGYQLDVDYLVEACLQPEEIDRLLKEAPHHPAREALERARAQHALVALDLPLARAVGPDGLVELLSQLAADLELARIAPSPKERAEAWYRVGTTLYRSGYRKVWDWGPILYDYPMEGLPAARQVALQEAVLRYLVRWRAAETYAVAAGEAEAAGLPALQAKALYMEALSLMHLVDWLHLKSGTALPSAEAACARIVGVLDRLVTVAPDSSLADDALLWASYFDTDAGRAGARYQRIFQEYGTGDVAPRVPRTTVPNYFGGGGHLLASFRVHNR